MTVATGQAEKLEKNILYSADISLPGGAVHFSVPVPEPEDTIVITVKAGTAKNTTLRVAANAVVRFAHLVLSSGRSLKTVFKGISKRFFARRSSTPPTFAARKVFLRI